MTAVATRWRRLVGVAVVPLALVAGTGVAVAAWSDREPISDADLHSGTVIVNVNGSTAVTIPATITPQLGTTSTAYVPLTITNDGNLAVDYRLDGTSASSVDPSLITSLTLSVGLPTSTAACSGGTPGTTIPLTTGTTIQDAAFTSRRPLAPGTSEVLCVSLTTSAVTNAAFRIGTATITMRFHGQNQ